MTQGIANKLVIGVLVLLVFSICAVIYVRVTQDPSIRASKRVTEIVSDVKYAKDKRTGICYAVYTTRKHDESGLTVVPCDKVKEQLVN